MYYIDWSNKCDPFTFSHVPTRNLARVLSRYMYVLSIFSRVKLYLHVIDATVHMRLFPGFLVHRHKDRIQIYVT